MEKSAAQLKSASTSAQRRLVVPEDFMTVICLVGSHGAAAHYRVSLTDITNWRRQMGLPFGVKAVTPKVRPRFRPKGAKQDEIKVDMSTAGQAAAFLRRLGPVFRCNRAGKPDDAGAFWNRAGWVLSDDEIVSRAVRLGWRKDEV